VLGTSAGTWKTLGVCLEWLLKSVLSVGGVALAGGLGWNLSSVA
jgi:hypothetical protein